MTVTSDGKSIVYAVFDADGYECKSLVGVFSDERKAQEFRDRYDAEEHGRFRKKYPNWRAEVTIEPVVLDEPLGEPCDCVSTD